MVIISGYLYSSGVVEFQIEVNNNDNEISFKISWVENMSKIND